MIATVEYTLFESVTGSVFEGLLQSREGTVRFVYQDGKLFFRQDLEKVTVQGKAGREDTLRVMTEIQ